MDVSENLEIKQSYTKVTASVGIGSEQGYRTGLEQGQGAGNTGWDRKSGTGYTDPG